MPRQELALFKAISTLQLSPALLKELRMALSSRKKTEVSAGGNSTAAGSGPKASQSQSGKHAGKCKVNELASSGHPIKQANRRLAPGDRSAPLPEYFISHGELAAVGSRQLGPPEEGVTYVAVLAGLVAPFQPSGSLKPSAMG